MLTEGERIEMVARMLMREGGLSFAKAIQLATDIIRALALADAQGGDQ
jgi:hypothetical protein